MDTFIINLVDGGNILMDILPSKSRKYEEEDYKKVEELIKKEMVEKALDNLPKDEEKIMVEMLRAFYSPDNFSNNLYRNLSHILLKKMYEKKNKGGGKRGKRGGGLSKPDMKIIKEMMIDKYVITKLLSLMINAWYLYSCIYYFAKVLNINVGEKIVDDSKTLSSIQESKALVLTSDVKLGDKELMFPVNLIQHEKFEPIKVKDLITAWAMGDGKLIEDFISTNTEIIKDALMDNLMKQLDLSKKSIMHQAYIKYWARKGVKPEDLAGLPEDPLSKKLAADWNKYVVTLQYAERTFLFLEQTTNPMGELQKAQTVIAEATQAEFDLRMFQLNKKTKEIVNDARAIVNDTQNKSITSLGWTVFSLVTLISIIANLILHYRWLKKKKKNEKEIADYKKRLKLMEEWRERFFTRQERLLDNTGPEPDLFPITRSSSMERYFLMDGEVRGGRKRRRKKTRKKRRKTRRKSKKRKSKRRKRKKTRKKRR